MGKLTIASALLLSAFLGSAAWTAAAPAPDDEKPKIPAPPKQAPKAKKPKPDFPPFAEVAKDYTKVVSTADGKPSLYGIWIRKKDGQMLAELPSGYQTQKHYFAMTRPTGEIFSGLQAGAEYVYWKRYDKRLALISPNLTTRSTGDQESKDSVARHFTDRVLVDVPIKCMGPGNQPVIDLDELLVGNAGVFYGSAGRGLKKSLTAIKKAKAFPENVELAFEIPTSGGALKTFHYSISRIPKSNGYKPRAADERVGYFTTSFRDLGKFRDDQVWVRYIDRWHLEKADPKLKMSPPKQPLVYYIDHTVPVRYRRWVKQGVLYWNKAFEKVGLKDAIEVYYQDKTTGAHMEKDPEDVRYNFIRWLSNDIGTAIGPSRAHPLTGQILDADIVLTDGWIRHFWYQSNEYLPQIAMEGLTLETRQWLERHPDWDPRLRLVNPAERDRILEDRARRQRERLAPGSGPDNHPDNAIGDDLELLSLSRDLGPGTCLCLAARGKAWDMTVMGMSLELLGLLEEEEDAEDDDTDEPEQKEEMIDGIPEWFVGPMLADLTVHEVGHTLGLRHNFKASGLYSLAEINSEELKGKKPFTASVMDYNPVNVNIDEAAVQGDYAMIDIGPYDYWAIEYGYTFDDPKKVLERTSEPAHLYATDYDTTGTDPLARRYDFSSDPLDYARSRVALAEHHRALILEKFVKEGDSWGKARRGYEITLGMQTEGLSIMANWLGGVFYIRDKKGDPGDRVPLQAVPAQQQRAALAFVIETGFDDAAFGLTPELLQYMSVEKWADGDASPYRDATWPIHDRISGIQASTLTMLMNPTTLRRIYDNEGLIPADQDAFTLAELLEGITDAIWSELGSGAGGKHTARKPLISSLRRNLQREQLDRLVDLATGAGSGASGRAMSDLAMHTLRGLNRGIGKAANSTGTGLDPYTAAHLSECQQLIAKVLDSQYILNADDMGGGGGGMPFFFFGRD